MPKPGWLEGFTHRDFVGCSEERWNKLDWSRAFVDLGPSPAGNLGPYWHVPYDFEGEELWDRLYPKMLQSKWLVIIRHACAETAKQLHEQPEEQQHILEILTECDRPGC